MAYLDEETAPAFIKAVGRTYVSDGLKFPRLVDWFKTPDLPDKSSWRTFVQLLRTLTELV